MNLSQKVENPFEILFNKVEQVESILARLEKQLQESLPSQPNPNERLTRKQLTAEYNVSLGTIHNLMKKGLLIYEKVGRKTLFRREDVERCFKSKRG